jgi:hypothetical protein
MSDSHPTLALRVHADIQTFKDRKQAIIDRCNDNVSEQLIVVSVANARIDDALKARDMALGKIGAEFMDYMSERYALEQPVTDTVATLPAEPLADAKPRRTRRAAEVKASADAAPPFAVTTLPEVSEHAESKPLIEEALDRAVTPPELATAVIPTEENPNSQATFTSQGPVVAPAKDVVVEVLPFEHWKKTMPTFTKSGGIINLLKSQPPEAWPVLRRAESAGLNRDSILRLIDAHVLDHEALARKSAAASATLAPLDDTDPPF